ncbi:MAG: cupin domain-containing protein [Acidimicrobiaceae bacterium]|nr:cupin domain-containing protein [Acidimicrobiaceae bacterium]
MADSARSYIPIRRIVAGHDESGKSVIISDGEAENYRGLGTRRSTLMWATKETPADFLNTEDAGLWKLGTPPPPGGTRFCIIESAPGATYPAMHRTDTVDYVICIKGEITMDLDDSTVVMKEGDVLIQLGTNHGWRNETDQPALVAFVLVDGKPKNSPKLPPPRI